ncbi:hypothetical protein LNTAR_21080 [Lentisphaera araneosa HTCC2155]|uniref:HipA N-terminal subdomain 1 domain-containing protein n=1 Tax=Lentisphaera araneosa HTCC2155 TaxID=313628 RepID=A6DLV0_9BACT|nr:HipA N-terminal domain-containing protein [Lentisphaera araneosa]EDM27248.1 hypothetical protein LNTAR_21080 [Lentisphaera araneosa HTCC2155]
MRKVEVSLHGEVAAVLIEYDQNHYSLEYLDAYNGDPISRALPASSLIYEFDHFPAFFDGLLPEGLQLQYLLKSMKIDEDDYMSQLIAIGDDFVGAISVRELVE